MDSREVQSLYLSTGIGAASLEALAVGSKQAPCPNAPQDPYMSDALWYPPSIGLGEVPADPKRVLRISHPGFPHLGQAVPPLASSLVQCHSGRALVCRRLLHVADSRINYAVYIRLEGFPKKLHAIIGLTRREPGLFKSVQT